MFGDGSGTVYRFTRQIVSNAAVQNAVVRCLTSAEFAAELMTAQRQEASGN